VNGLGLLKGSSAVKAVVAVDQAYAGWALTDEILRMMTRSGPVAETFPSRLFTKQNIAGIQVTPRGPGVGRMVRQHLVRKRLRRPVGRRVNNGPQPR